MMNYIKLTHAIEELQAKEAKAEADIVELKADVAKIKDDIKVINK